MTQQTQEKIKQEKKKDYVFEHKRTRKIEGTDILKQAKIIAGSPSWKPVSDKAKGLAKKTSSK